MTEAVQARADLESARQYAGAEVDGARRVLGQAIVAHADEIILGLRPLMDAMIEKARPHAAQLERFAPGYSAGDVVNQGDAKDLKAYQAAAQLEREFGWLISCWRAIFGEVARPETLTGSSFDVRDVPPPRLFFANVGAVVNPALNGTLLNRRGYPVYPQPIVLNVAAEDPAVGFRLATWEEAGEIFASLFPRSIEGVRRFRMRAI